MRRSGGFATSARAGLRASLASTIALVLSAAPGAGCTKSVAANALIAAGATVAAAAAIRAATNSCYANCAYGTVCNHRTGFCEAQTPAQLEAGCVDNQGENHCGDDEPTSASAAIPVPEEDDPCAGMCLDGETCVMRHGNLTCEGTPRRDPGPPAEED
jgi:hypothetical protein